MQPPFLLSWGLAALVVGSVPACWLVQPTGCDASLAPMLKLTLVDATTGEQVTKPFIITIITQATGDSTVLALPAAMIQPFNVFHSATGSRFTLGVKVDGYRPWRRANIDVDTDGCGRWDTRAVRAVLVPL